MNVLENLQYFFDTYGDSRVEGWFLMSSPLPTVFICLAYTIFVTKIGPKLMENREPFKLRKTIIFYNFVQILLNSYLFYEAWVCGWLTFCSCRGQPVDYSNNPLVLRTVHICYFFYLAKFFDFFDTVFFVLRKNNHQISAQHVIYHGVMPISWLGVRFSAGDHLNFFVFLNTFVHIIIYFHYMIRTLRPQYKKYLWWKKYLSILQILQFIAIGIHSAHLLFFECDYSQAFIYLVLGLFFYLFYKLYEKKYMDSIFNEKALMGMCFPGGFHDDSDTKLE